MILWDAVDMMQRHIPDGSIDVALVAVPFFLRVPPDQRATDYYLELNGEKPRFRADWDSFASIEQYETFCSEWIDEVMRRLHKTSPATSSTWTEMWQIAALDQPSGVARSARRHPVADRIRSGASRRHGWRGQ